MNIVEKILALNLLPITDKVKASNNLTDLHSNANGCELKYYRLHDGDMMMYSHEYLESHSVDVLLASFDKVIEPIDWR